MYYDKSFAIANLAQSVRTAEYADSIFEEVYDTPRNECPGYDTKPADVEDSVLEIWGMRSTTLWPLFTGSF